jgi:hypothetical protein
MTTPELGIVAPVKRSATLRQTVGYAIGQALDRAADGETAAVHFVSVAAWRADDPGSGRERQHARDLLDQVETWAGFELDEADAGGDAITVETAVIGDDSYVFSPGDYADLLTEYAESYRLGRVVVDPEYELVGHTTLVEPLEFELAQRDSSLRRLRSTAQRDASGLSAAPRPPAFSPCLASRCCSIRYSGGSVGCLTSLPALPPR